MSDASGEPAQAEGLIIEIWTENRTIFKALVTDALLFMAVLGALLVCSVALHALQRAGYNQSRLAFLELIHYYAYLIVSIMFLIDLVLKLFMHLFRRGQ
jgi:hypothetical protein